MAASANAFAEEVVPVSLSTPQKIALCKCSCPCVCCHICGSFIVVPWLGLILLSIMSGSSHPSWCADPIPAGAAKTLRDSVYDNDNTIDWTAFGNGWNPACGTLVGNLSDMAANYAQETGNLQLIPDDSGFKNNAWTPLNFKKVMVKEAGPVDNFPFGSRARTIQSFGRLCVVNLFFMPTATAEVAFNLDLQYEICAYFGNPDGSRPTRRLYKTTKSPLGISDPFVQEFVSLADGENGAIYNAVTDMYNDANDGKVGKAQFSVEETKACQIWSGIPLFLIALFTVLLITHFALLAFLRYRFGARRTARDVK
eukprot:TRINITY_DN26830_c0_g1_i1.p1 TRINITY_DN26830_c0_g1~~TRINITY_DN26830_c0_g1_i1.p1  ORF type:complete len:311 (-),score=60.41 TRINITY_DN26830_c0_g1_i1:95-1027(-)